MNNPTIILKKEIQLLQLYVSLTGMKHKFIMSCCEVCNSIILKKKMHTRIHKTPHQQNNSNKV